MGMYGLSDAEKAKIAIFKANHGHSPFEYRKPTKCHKRSYCVRAVLETYPNGDMKVYEMGEVKIIRKHQDNTRTFWEKLPNGKIRVHKAVNVRPIGKASKAA